VVTGTEHFADALTSMACAAIPVSDGAGEMIGVTDLACSADDFNPLLLPFAKRAARDIGHRLTENVNPRRLTVSSWLSLTDTERIVADLAAQGLSSRVVADRMLLPQPTVRSHLRRVFRKLGVRSKVELARVVEQAAWARTMAAVDDIRQQIQRDLHDGLQQRLVTLGLQVREVEAAVRGRRRLPRRLDAQPRAHVRAGRASGRNSRCHHGQPSGPEAKRPHRADGPHGQLADCPAGQV